MTPVQAEALRLRIQAITPKPRVYIKCRTIERDCEKLASVLFDVLKKVQWPVAQPMTTQTGNVSSTGEQGIKVISKSGAALQLKNALQAAEVGNLPAELELGSDEQTILINIGTRP